MVKSYVENYSFSYSKTSERLFLASKPVNLETFDLSWLRIEILKKKNTILMLISIEFSGADFIGQKVGYVASIVRFIGEVYFSFVDVLTKQ